MAIVKLTPEEEKYSDMKLWAQNLERENDKLKLRLARLEKIEEDMEERCNRAVALLTHSRYITWSDILCWKCEKPIHGYITWLQSNPPKPVHTEKKDCLKEKRERK